MYQPSVEQGQRRRCGRRQRRQAATPRHEQRACSSGPATIHFRRRCSRHGRYWCHFHRSHDSCCPCRRRLADLEDMDRSMTLAAVRQIGAAPMLASGRGLVLRQSPEGTQLCYATQERLLCRTSPGSFWQSSRRTVTTKVAAILREGRFLLGGCDPTTRTTETARGTQATALPAADLWAPQTAQKTIEQPSRSAPRSPHPQHPLASQRALRCSTAYSGTSKTSGAARANCPLFGDDSVAMLFQPPELEEEGKENGKQEPGKQ